MIFAYRTTTLDGTIHEGTIEAEDQDAAVEKLKDKGFIPLTLKAQKEGARGGGEISFSLRSGKIDLITFTTELSALLNAGLPLDRGLHIISDISENGATRQIVQAILKSIREGSSFSDALQKHPKVFPRLYVNMVRAGESGGILQNVLERLGEFMESSKELRDHVTSAMIYPAILMVTGIASIILLFTFVLPRFAGIFTELGGSLPLPTQILLSVTGAIRSIFWFMLVAIVAGIVVIRKTIRSDAGRYQWDRLKLKLLGDLLVKLETARFCRTLGTLITSGVPLLQSLKNARDVMNNRVMAAAIDTVMKDTKEGKGIAQPLAEVHLFPALALSMIKVGEETGQLNTMLIKVAVIYEKSLREAVKRFVSFLEPAMILFMGLVIGFIVVSMLMAIFSITDLPI
ncbi:MAG TPA: type II secretion system protein GspF [Syntrophus sp. (in: bacteria)]|nr:type II secretion system protein GspF [Syntrophus sp. (in: bacteria)]